LGGKGREKKKTCISSLKRGEGKGRKIRQFPPPKEGKGERRKFFSLEGKKKGNKPAQLRKKRPLRPLLIFLGEGEKKKRRGGKSDAGGGKENRGLGPPFALREERSGNR